MSAVFASVSPLGHSFHQKPPRYVSQSAPSVNCQCQVTVYMIIALSEVESLSAASIFAGWGQSCGSCQSSTFEPLRSPAPASTFSCLSLPIPSISSTAITFHSLPCLHILPMIEYHQLNRDSEAGQQRAVHNFESTSNLSINRSPVSQLSLSR